MAEQVFNNFRAPLVSDIDDAATSLVLDVSALPEGLASQVTEGLDGNTMRIGIDDELMNVTGTSLDGTELTLTVTRAIESTTAAAHSAGTYAANVWTKAGLLAYVADNTPSSGVALAADEGYDGASPVASAALLVGVHNRTKLRLTLEDASTSDLELGNFGSTNFATFGMYFARVLFADLFYLLLGGAITRDNSNRFQGTAASGIALAIAPGGLILNAFEAYIDIVPDMDYQYFVVDTYIGNADGTQVLRVTANVGVPPNTTEMGIDFSTASAIPIVGDDLVWDGGNQTVRSTAGGVFSAVMTIQGGID